MGEFKDGAFKIAIEKQIPIVPVTIPYNWLILPDDGKWSGRPHIAMAIFHEPIETRGMTLENLGELMTKTREVITKELALHNPNINFQVDYSQHVDRKGNDTKDSALSEIGI